MRVWCVPPQWENLGWGEAVVLRCLAWIEADSLAVPFEAIAGATWRGAVGQKISIDIRESMPYLQSACRQDPVGARDSAGILGGK